MIGVGGLAAFVSAYGIAFRLPRLAGREDELLFFIVRLRVMAQLLKASSHEAI